MLKIGLTGGIGSGKSTAAQIFREENIPVIDADVVSMEVLQLYPEILYKIRACFGDEFFDEESRLDRKKLGKYIFEHNEKRVQLEAIIIPFIIKEIFDRIRKYAEAGELLCIVDAPTLIEQGLHKLMDKNILIWADEKNQLHRVSRRDNLNEEDIKARIAAQMPFSEKKKHVDYIIDNNEGLEKTKEQIQEILKKIRESEKTVKR
jgi:dephospho-CoA kinase